MGRDGRGDPLTSEEAFKMLGNESRLSILQALGDADGPLPFAELYEPLDLPDSANLAYHLDILRDHFVTRTDDGYELTEAGRQVVIAVAIGMGTPAPSRPHEPVSISCAFCGAQVEVFYRDEHVHLFCTGCDGLVVGTPRANDEESSGFIGRMRLPPAGVHGRTAAELLDAATTWSHLDLLSRADDVCPRCSAAMEHELDLCGNHDLSGGLCERCGRRYAIGLRSLCTNCIHSMRTYFGLYLMDEPDLVAFVARHGINPVTDGIEWGWEFDEELLSTDPFRARFTLELDGDRIAFRVDDGFEVVAVERSSAERR
ncbi:MAG: ArsR/SmtB family transcription factor [Halobacteriota archaeon]